MDLLDKPIIQTSHIDTLVGNTPLYPIRRVFSKQGIQIFAKLEWMQMGASVKCRPAFNIIKEALASGDLPTGKQLLDASSGNTAIAYAAIGASLGIGVTICIPENASNERKEILRAYGATLIFTSKFGGTDEAQFKAKEMAKSRPDKYFYADQYNNPNNWLAHYQGTAEEIFRQTNGLVTHLVVGLGTTGTAMGTYKKLKELNRNIKLITLQPEFALHNLEGWKHLETALVPGIYQSDLAVENLSIDSEEALKLIPRVAEKEGLLLSPSAAANLLGAIKVAKGVENGLIVTVFPDNADKYAEIMKSLSL